MFSAAARRSLPIFLPATAAACGTTVSSYLSPSSSDYSPRSRNNTARCDASSSSSSRGDSSSVVLRKRMTSIGRFSMKSETKDNPSIPTFFIALSGKPAKGGDKVGSSNAGMSSAEFESSWMKSEMPSRHPRFHSRVSPHDDRYFEYETESSTSNGSESGMSSDSSDSDDEQEDPKAELHRHVSETVHPSSYRSDLRMRIERLLTEPIDLTDKLWEVFVSSGELGSSGAISRLKVDHVRQDDKATIGAGNNTRNCENTDDVESLLLFRSHHTLADGVSLISALGDLVDEAEEIRDAIKAELQKKKHKSKDRSFLQRLLYSLTKLIWFCVGSIQSLLYQMYLLWTTPCNPFEEALGISSSSSSQEKTPGRSVSWCDAAPLAEVKAVARSVGPKVTLNDVFVSCVSAAVARQLEENRERAAVMREAVTGKTEETDVVHPSSSNINVVVPVHLMGGAILPGKSVGNNIGAFVVRVPAHMVCESTTPASDRLRSVHSSLTAVKKSPTPILSYLVARFASDYLPEGLAKRMFKNANANAAVAVSNARGWDKKVHINGRSIESSHGFLPLPPGLPCGVVIQSYAGIVSISVTAEKWAVPDADRFIGWMLDEYRTLCEECQHKGTPHRLDSFQSMRHG